MPYLDTHPLGGHSHHLCFNRDQQGFGDNEGCSEAGCNDACDWYQLDDRKWIAAFLVEAMPEVTLWYIHWGVL